MSCCYCGSNYWLCNENSKGSLRSKHDVTCRDQNLFSKYVTRLKGGGQ